MMDKTRLGKAPEANQGRDAVHVAVIPRRVATEMAPGTHVGINASGMADMNARPLIGIIDPFINHDNIEIFLRYDIPLKVEAGNTAWVLLYPETITTLRHVWEHPVIDSIEAVKPSDDKRESIEWMTRYAADNCPYFVEAQCTPDEIYRRFMQTILVDKEVFYYGCDLHDASELNDPEQFFRHLSVIMGRAVTPDELTYSCTC